MAKPATVQRITPPRTYSTDDLAAALGLCTRTIRRMADAGAIPGRFRVGGRIRYRADEIDRWISAGCPRGR